jgi:hypothetical protein
MELGGHAGIEAQPAPREQQGSGKINATYSVLYEPRLYARRALLSGEPARESAPGCKGE